MCHILYSWSRKIELIKGHLLLSGEQATCVVWSKCLSGREMSKCKSHRGGYGRGTARVVWPGVMEEAVGHAYKALLGHAEAFVAKMWLFTTVTQSDLLCRRVMWNWEWAWAHILMNTSNVLLFQRKIHVKILSWLGLACGQEMYIWEHVYGCKQVLIEPECEG